MQKMARLLGDGLPLRLRGSADHLPLHPAWPHETILRRIDRSAGCKGQECDDLPNALAYNKMLMLAS
jgi:hypothetical protein